MMRSLICFLSICFFVAAFSPVLSYSSTNIRFDTFSAMIGMDDGCLGRPGAVIFRVLFDGKEVFKSGIMKPGEPPKYIAIPLYQAKQLTLIVEDTGDGHGGDWGNWGDARLVDNQTGEVFFLSDMKAVVEQRWIDTQMDRNIIQEPIKMDGEVYAKGLGAISGSRMSYSQWDEIWSWEKNEALEEDIKALKKLGRIHFSGECPLEAQVIINGKDSKDANRNVSHMLSAGDKIEIIFSTSTKENIFENHALWAFDISFGKNHISLTDLLPSRIEHCIPANEEIVDEETVILNGRRYLAATGSGYPVKIVYENLAAQVLSQHELNRESSESKRKGRILVGEIGIDSSKKNPFATIVFSIRLDGKITYRSRLITKYSAPETVFIPFPESSELELIVSDAGDGRYQDNAAWGDIAIIEKMRGKASGMQAEYVEQYPLSSFIPYISESGWGRIGLNYSARGEYINIEGKNYATGFGVYAPSRIAFRNLGKTIKTRSDAVAEIEKIKRLLKGKTDLLSIEENVLKARSIDDTVSDIYPLLGVIAENKGDIQGAIDAWEQVIDISHATRCEKRIARNIIDKLYQKGSFTEFDRHPLNLPPILNHPIKASALSNSIFTVIVGEYGNNKDKEILAPGSFTLDVGKEDAGKYCTLLVNARGLKPFLRIAKADEARQKSIAEYLYFSEPLPSKNDYLYQWKLKTGQWIIFVDYSRANAFDNTCSFILSYTLSENPPEKPTQEWEYRLSNTGVADAKCTITGSTLVIVPHTADSLEIEGAKHYLCHPIYEYGSKLDYPYSMGQILLLIPEENKAVIKFRWLDAAYNVPMTKYGSDRKDAFFFKSIQGIDPSIEEAKVVVTVPDGTGEVKLLVPETKDIAGNTYTWTVAWDKSITISAKHPSLDTKWLSEKHRAMTVYLPDNPYNKLWLPEYMKMLSRIYDRESFLMGDYEPETETFVYVTGPAQLSGYGGATWGGKESETWIGSTARIGEYHLRYQPGGDGVEAHELKWVFCGGAIPSLPRWINWGNVIWLEEQGKYAGNLAFPDYWTRTELMPQSQLHLDMFTKSGTGYALLDDDEFEKLTNEQKKMGDAMAWRIFQLLHERYGEQFWPEFWKHLRKEPDVYTNLDPRSRTIKAVNAIVDITEDKSIRKQFERWGFDLSPDKQYSKKYFCRLPKEWAFKTGDDKSWSKMDFDDSSWEKIEVGKPWESAKTYSEYDGYAWYRIRFIWPSGMNQENIVIDLGKIDDCDEVYFNGETIGATGTLPPEYMTSWTIPRRYSVPGNLIHENGENVIAVRVYDGTGNGGIYDRVPSILSLIRIR